MTLLLIIVGYILNVIINRWLYIQLQKCKNKRYALEFNDVDFYFIVFASPIWTLGAAIYYSCLFISLTKFKNWFKYTPILLLFVFGSCSETIQEKSYEHRWCIKVKYYDNTLDTLTGQNWYTPQLCSNGEVYCAGTIANQVKTMTLLKDTLVEL